MTKPEDLQTNVWNDLKKANDALLEKQPVTLVGGPADGTVFQIPVGVNSLEVEAHGETIEYRRSNTSESDFEVYLG